ncbi:hypothetical protein NDN08_008128 [Rhodosorus marinus]|uniref:Homeobox domain-containing protein n=1 Tax=Rhodosorus marinus TaxID=101924 RepID=A0AAV8UZL8_9RHOD|nr:hypothetical protein NDN08_008128 [Rhodosorus marinus]
MYRGPRSDSVADAEAFRLESFGSAVNTILVAAKSSSRITGWQGEQRLSSVLSPVGTPNTDPRVFKDGEGHQWADSVPSPLETPKLGSRIFTDAEQQILKETFRQDPYPPRKRLRELSDNFEKPLYKVKTWFNNRRAKVRRLASADRGDGQVPNNTVHREMVDGGAVVGKKPITGAGSVVKPDPSSLGSPFTPANTTTSTPLLIPNNRRQRLVPDKTPPPTILKGSSLSIGNWTCTGCEGKDSEALGDGLEVKFLYGRRRVVYEFCSAESLDVALERGGPFSKVDVLFDNIEKLSVETKTPNTGIRLTLKSDPDIYAQEPSNFAAYKSRKKQRQYIRSQDATLLSIFSHANEHFISMDQSRGEAIREKLVQLEPRFSRMISQVAPSTGIAPTLECITPRSTQDRNSLPRFALEPQDDVRARRTLDFAETPDGRGYSVLAKLPPLPQESAGSAASIYSTRSAPSFSRMPLLPPLTPLIALTSSALKQNENQSRPGQVPFMLNHLD